MSRSKSKGGSSQKSLQVHISTGTIFRVLAVVLAVVFVYFLRELVVVVLAALLLAALIDPAVSWMQKRNIPRGWGVAAIYLVVIALTMVLGFLVVPPTIEQTQELADQYAPVVRELSDNQVLVSGLISGDIFEQDFTQVVTTLQESGAADAIPVLVEIITETFGFFVTLILIFILAFYMVSGEDVLKSDVSLLAPEKYRTFVSEIGPKLRRKVGFWLRAQLLVMFIIFILTYVVLTIMGVPFALLLALTAGLLEIIPFLGPWLSAVPAVLIALSISPLQALLVAAAYFLIQQLEGDVLSPKIMQKVAGLNPVVSILSVLVGFEVAGIMGALLAIPFAMVVGVLLQELAAAKK